MITYVCIECIEFFLTDYKDFGIKKNGDLHWLYLYKCFAFLPYSIIETNYYLLNKIDVTNELSILTDEYDNKNFGNLVKFIDFLKKVRQKLRWSYGGWKSKNS